MPTRPRRNRIAANPSTSDRITEAYRSGYSVLGVRAETPAPPAEHLASRTTATRWPEDAAIRAAFITTMLNFLPKQRGSGNEEINDAV